MSWLYRALVRPLLFTQEPERIHDFTLRGLSWASRRPWACAGIERLCGADELPVEAFGLRFPNPVGLAAGMDKHADALAAWPALGFGFTELGAVTWHAQPGNPLPRIFRVQAEQALINRMGFNNPGADALAERLRALRAAKRWPGHPLGINLGKSKITPLEAAAQDYVGSYRRLRDLADFFVVNVSSPNTPNLRQLQDRTALDEILAALQEAQREAPTLPQPMMTGSKQHSSGCPSSLKTREVPPSIPAKPMLVKVAPDLSFDALDQIIELIKPRQISGIIATNTTLARPATDDPARQRLYAEPGGLSGKPLRARSTEVIRHLYRQSRGSVPIMGVGGIFNAADAWEKITAGASLVQLYTGLVYEGPTLPRQIVRGLRQRLKAAGLADLQQAVGIEART
jgi:dihydroorotate dehydrogenase